ncbi:hypothetical protein ACFW95_19550 [Streptomyces sp. NPDC059474]|uniref:hypothetical protein n=1 Tax=Streptomyces sp. NPDC059474 TaxID=3346846 RepID=UPI0036ADEA2D
MLHLMTRQVGRQLDLLQIQLPVGVVEGGNQQGQGSDLPQTGYGALVVTCVYVAGVQNDGNHGAENL